MNGSRVHPLVEHLRFARSELVRCLDGVSEADGCRRLPPMNSISWIVGHLANQEHAYWVVAAQGKRVAPQLDDLVGYGRPASTPPLAEMWAVWRAVTSVADAYLVALTPPVMASHLTWQGEPFRENVGTLLWRNMHHYWFHIGEAHAIRQQMGQRNLPDFVGSMADLPYQAGDW